MTEHDRGSREGSTSETARDTAGEVGKQARAAAGNVKAAAQEKSEALMGRAEEKAREKKSQASEMIGALATALHAAGDKLREQRQDRLGRMGNETADQVDRMASYIERNDVRGLMDDLERFGRRNPAAFLGLTFVGGLLAGRFLRSSPSHDGEARERPDERDLSSDARSGRARHRGWEREREREHERETYREPGTPGTQRAATGTGGGTGTGDTFPTDPMVDETAPSIGGMSQDAPPSLGTGRTPPAPGMTTPRTSGTPGGTPGGSAGQKSTGGRTGGTNE